MLKLHSCKLTKKAILVGALVTLLVTAISTSAWAKASSVKLTVSGGGLAGTMTITDPRVLAASNVWMGRFIDDSKPPFAKPPAGLRSYIVTFYAGLARGVVRKAYVVTYRPNPAARRGYIYLPGRGDADAERNWGSIIGPGRDGMWNYAAPGWSEMLDAAIARARRA